MYTYYEIAGMHNGVTIARNPYEGVMRAPNRGTAVDMHERLKEEIYKQNGTVDTAYRLGAGGDAGSSTSQPVGSDVAFASTYIMFTSLDKSGTSEPSNGKISFSIPQLNLNNTVSNIVKFRIHPFRFPHVSGPSTQPDLYFYRRIYIQVSPLSANSVRGPSNAQHHFEFDIAQLTARTADLRCVGAEGERGEFVFATPTSELSEITFQFMVMNPTSPSRLVPIPLPQERLTVRTVPNTNPAQFTVLGGDTTVPISAVIGVQPAPGITVYLSGLNTNVTAVDNAVNSVFGHFVTTIISTTQFEIAGLDFTVAPLNVTPYDLPLVIAVNTFTFTIEFISALANKRTQFVQVTHK